MRAFTPAPPRISLRHFTPAAYSDAIAAARTCYATDIVHAKDVSARQKETIGPLTFNAGHHTVYQHATFEFSLENVSRHFVWSVLHSFPYYNSDQQSQRYVRLKELRAYTPSVSGQLLSDYQTAIVRGFDVYEELTAALQEDTYRIVSDIRHLNRHPQERLIKKVRNESQKKAIEVARYVLPIATYTSLVYTCSGLVLHRLWRLMNTGDLCAESEHVIGEMLRQARLADPEFFETIGDGPLEPHAIPEAPFYQDPQSLAASETDTALGEQRFSKLISFTQNPEPLLALAGRMALGPKASKLSDSDLIAHMLDPKLNHYRVEKANLAMHSPLMRCLEHVRYTFFKRLSHSADSQNQRHRTVIGSRPFLTSVLSDTPDYYTPLLIESSPRAKDVYTRYMEDVWQTKNRLIRGGMAPQDALYVLPNALRLRFVESGSLLNLIHKWTQRTCLNAQEEIFRASMEEITQVCEVHPFLKRFVGPPCVIRNGVTSPRCTEGDHFCGVPVWKQFPNISRRL